MTSTAAHTEHRVVLYRIVRDYVISNMLIKALEKLDMHWPQPDLSKDRVE